MKPIKLLLLFTAAAVSFGVGLISTLHSAERFDKKVRNDFFAGFNGDREALGRGLKATSEVLATEPDHAEALVWHGSGTFFQAGEAFRGGDPEKGMKLYGQGMAEMDRAVALQPDSIGVRIPRGATLLTATRFMPGNPDSPKLLEKGLSDYEAALKIQEPHLDSLGTHPKGELLFGLAEGWSRMGDQAKAQAYFERVASELKGTPYASRAAIWLDKKALSPEQTGCIGCHVSK